MEDNTIIGYVLIVEYPNSLEKGSVINNKNFFHTCSMYPLFFKPIFEIQAGCDVCGSDDVIESPQMGRNCNRCNPL